MQIEKPLEITLLGIVEVKRENVLLTNFRHRKSLALLAYLAITRESYSRERLAGLLWGQASDANALGGLRKVLAELRILIGPYLLEHGRQVAFNHDLPCYIDVLDFERGLSGILDQKVEMLDAEKSNTLRQVIDLYQGDFLAGFYIQRARDFEDWVTLKREQLRISALEGFYLLSKAAYLQSDYSDAIHYSRRLLELEPCHEEAHRQLMSLFALTGQREMALRQYENCREVIAETYDLAPQEETIALYERIRQEPVNSAQETGFYLPTPSTPLLGRQDDLNKLQLQLAAPDCRMLTIIGPGGSGKTHLALELAAVISQSDTKIYPDGIAFIPLSALSSLETLPSAIAYQLGFQFHKETAPIKQLSEYLADRHMLLILDNFEHLLKQMNQEDEKSIESGFNLVFRQAPGIKWLVTSRVRLNLKEEHIYSLDGIEFPTENTKITSSAVTAPAVALFIQSARRIAPDFEVTNNSVAEIVKICQRVRGLPLGILLAASWSNLLSPAQINARLSTESGIDLLESETENFPIRQRSMRVVLTYSWKMLSSEQQSTLAALSIFPGNFNIEAAQEVGKAALSDLRSLIDHSLLKRTSAGRFEIHEFTRQFAHEKLEDQMQVQTRYLDYYAAQMRDWQVDLKSARQIETVKIMDDEIDNLHAAWNRAVSAENLVFIDQAIEGLCFYYSTRQRFSEGVKACREVVEYFQNSGKSPEIKNTQKNKLLFAKSLAWLGALSPLNQAENPLHQSVSLLDELEKSAYSLSEIQPVRAFAFSELGSVFAEIGKHAEAEKLFKQSIAICEKNGNRWLLSDNLKKMASQLWDQSQYEQSKQYLLRGLEILDEIGDSRFKADALSWLGIITLFQGDVTGEKYIRESLKLYSEFGQQVMRTVEIASIALIVLGKFEEARTLIEERAQMDLRIPFRQDSIQSVYAAILIHLGRYDESRDYVQIKTGQVTHIANSYSFGFALVARGWLALIDNDFAYADDLFRQSAEQCDQYDLKDIYTWALSSQGLTKYRSGNLPAAQKIFLKCFQATDENVGFVGKAFTAAFSLPVIMALDGGELAVELYYALQQIPMFANSVFFGEFIRQDVEKFASDLPKEVIDRLKEGGQALELDDIIQKVFSFFEEKSGN